MEEWRPIKGFEDSHQVSNKGRVRSIPHITNNNHYVKGTILSPEKIWTGYLRVHLRGKRCSKKFYVHRLVATAFIDNPTNLPYINHIDECKHNNAADNLEWCTQRYNLKYGTRCRRVLDSCKKSASSNAEKPIAQILNGVIINTYPSIHEAARQTNISLKLISRVCNNIRKQTHGYEFKFL